MIDEEVKAKKNPKTETKFEPFNNRGYSSFGKMVLSTKASEPSYKIGRALREKNNVRRHLTILFRNY